MRLVGKLSTILIACAFLLTAGCGDDDTDTHDGHEAHEDQGDGSSTETNTPTETAEVADLVVPETYTFESQFADNQGEDSVSYSGQIARHILIHEVNATIDGLTARIDAGEAVDAAQDLTALYLHDSDVVSELAFSMQTNDATPIMQQNLDEVSTGKNLKSKMAGEDYALDTFAGWQSAIGAGDTVPTSPHALFQAFVGWIDGMANERRNGIVYYDPSVSAEDRDAASALPVYLNETGHDLKQLVQKFLLGAVTFSQGTGDYLFNIEAKDNVDPYKGTKNHTAMEHNWDEAFGYFGAARDYTIYTDDEIAGKGGRDDWQKFHDSNADGEIDLTREYNFGHSINAAKRDRGTDPATDFTGDAFKAFARGRALISAHVGMNFSDWSADAQADLRAQVLGAQVAWEKAIAATVVHYINDVVDDMGLDTADYSYANHAKHWGEMKGFALGLQFNPWSPLHDVLDATCYDMTTHRYTDAITQEACGEDNIWTAEQSGFDRFHQKVGDAPVLPGAATNAILAYGGSLLAARNVIAEAYGFEQANVENW